MEPNRARRLAPPSGRFPTPVIEQVSKRSQNHGTLRRLELLVTNVLKETPMAPETREKGYKTKISVNQSLNRDLKLDPQLIDWAKGS